MLLASPSRHAARYSALEPPSSFAGPRSTGVTLALLREAVLLDNNTSMCAVKEVRTSMATTTRMRCPNCGNIEMRRAPEAA
jgi:predicted RNA-binding Zn-ribbon protein involved in translation (DUF1610 family)